MPPFWPGFVPLIPTPEHLRPLPAVAGPRFLHSSLPLRCLHLGAPDSSRAKVPFALTWFSQMLAQRTGLSCRLQSRGGNSLSALPAADILCACDANSSLLELLPADLQWQRGQADEQSYSLYLPTHGPMVLVAPAEPGLLYALATLLQLIQRDGRQWRVPPVAIRDRPAFTYRGVNWMLRAEIEGLSYDRGDGLAAYEARLGRQLDRCAQYKINAVYLDGFDWNTRRYPGYAPAMRRLGAAARQRGIHLIYGGRVAGFIGSEAKLLGNRRHYPGGADYACMGLPANMDPPQTSRFCGTCFSNEALAQRITRRLVDFVRRVEPGMLYLHHLDTGLSQVAQAAWRQRCPQCQERWPSHRVEARDGLAGAVAEQYGKLIDAIAAVRNPRSGYDALRDCLPIIVTPVYGAFQDSDGDWDRACDYLVALSRFLGRERRLALGIREQMARHDGPELRSAELAGRLERRGGGHGLMILHFFGGENFYNGYPLLATPAMNACFSGAAGVLSFNGNAYQEPQQLLNGEFAWNARKSRWRIAPLPPAYLQQAVRHLRLSSLRDRPAAIFAPGPDRFLDVACQRLYGPSAGPLVAKAYRLAGGKCWDLGLRRKTGVGAPFYLSRASLWLPAWNQFLPFRSRLYQHRKIAWQPGLDPLVQRNTAHLAGLIKESAALNDQARPLLQQAARRAIDTAGQQDLRWLGDTLGAAGAIGLLTAGALELLLQAQRSFATAAQRRAWQRRCHSLARKATGQAQAVTGEDLISGDLSRRRLTLKTLAQHLRGLAGGAAQNTMCRSGKAGMAGSPTSGRRRAHRAGVA